MSSTKRAIAGNVLVQVFFWGWVAGSNGAAHAEELSEMEQFHFDQLKSWVDEGGNPYAVRKKVIETCRELVMLTATTDEKAAFNSQSNMEDYNLRLGFCLSATLNRIRPQIEFKMKSAIRETCEMDVRVLRLVCSVYGLPEQ